MTILKEISALNFINKMVIASTLQFGDVYETEQKCLH